MPIGVMMMRAMENIFRLIDLRKPNAPTTLWDRSF